MILQIIILGFVLLVLPILVGGIFVRTDDDGRAQLAFRWVSGQICLWAGFQAICVPIVLRPREQGFYDVIGLYGVFAAAMLLFALAMSIKRYAGGQRIRFRMERGARKDIAELLLWGVVLVLFAVQVVLSAVLAYEEGDDAFYVATSTITAEAGSMYEILPYTGGGTMLDARHGLAPLPIWVAMLARLSGMHPATVAQIVLPPVLIAMAYTIYYMIGRRLFCDRPKSLPLFLLFLEIMVIFGGQSLYTAENFLLVRTAQGKAVLAAIVIPFLVLLLLLLFERLQRGERLDNSLWLLIALTMTTGCLCSTQGALLTCMFLGVGGACGAVCYRRWRLIFPMGLCCVVPAATAFLYLMLD